MRTALLTDNEEAIAYNGGDNLEEINFHTYAQSKTAGASNLRLQITGTETTVKNDLVADGTITTPTIETGNIRLTGEATDAITLSSNLINCSKNVQINVTDNNFGLFVAPNNNQACLYSGKQYGTQVPSGLLVQGFLTEQI